MKIQEYSYWYISIIILSAVIINPEDKERFQAGA